MRDEKNDSVVMIRLPRKLKEDFKKAAGRQDISKVIREMMKKYIQDQEQNDGNKK